MHQTSEEQNMQNGHNKTFQQQKQYWEQWDALPPQSSSLWRRYRSQHPSFQLGYCGCVVTFALIFLTLCSFGTIIGTIPQMTAHQSTTFVTTNTPTPAPTMTVANPTQQVHITTSPTPSPIHPTPILVHPTPNLIHPTPTVALPTPTPRPKTKKH